MPLSSATLSATTATDALNILSEQGLLNVNSTESILEIILMIISAGVAFAATIATFVIGLFKSAYATFNVSENELTSNRTFLRLIIMPFTFLTFGILIYTLIATSFAIFYDADLALKIKQFWEFTGLDLSTVPENKLKAYQFLSDLLLFLRFIVIHIILFTFTALPILYGAHALRIAESVNSNFSTVNNTNIWKILFYTMTTAIIGILIITVFNNIVSSIIFHYPPNIPHLGTVTDLFDLVHKKINIYVKIAFSNINSF